MRPCGQNPYAMILAAGLIVPQYLHGTGVRSNLIHDGGGEFCKTGFDNVLHAAGAEIMRIPPRAPNCNPHIERFFGSLKSECLHRFWLVGDRGLRPAVSIYCDFHNLRRDRGCSQPELASKVDSSTTMIGRYQRGVMTPAVDTVAKLADVFGVTMDHLYHGEGIADAVPDKVMTERLKAFATLRPADQAHILATFDALTHDAQT